ncbi:hypothetical protein GOP47_0020067 [Adiantum capillus-veneris]|uniref:Uncharacterized protein n=1 Tax=Adiantum capillus-veneris TaxID=13818 RepID=A0A9D4UCR2_ADICA|nr:hypothetical protein GOP47_0020067 [Adiantum capillus-veneris]
MKHLVSDILRTCNRSAMILCACSTSMPWWASSQMTLLQLKFSGPLKLNLPKARLLVSECSFQSQESVERNDAAISGPLFGPHPRLTAEDAVKVQLHALSKNDEPRRDHGLEVMYHFANAEGMLEGGTLSCYFGFPADLYHFGHFSLKFKSRFKELLCLKSFHIGNQNIYCKGLIPTARVQVQVTLAGGEILSFTFFMSKIKRGSQSPCWLTDAIAQDEI